MGLVRKPSGYPEARDVSEPAGPLHQGVNYPGNFLLKSPDAACQQMEAVVNPQTQSLPVEWASGARSNHGGWQFSQEQAELGHLGPGASIAACADLQSVWDPCGLPRKGRACKQGKGPAVGSVGLEGQVWLLVGLPPFLS